MTDKQPNIAPWQFLATIIGIAVAAVIGAFSSNYFGYTRGISNSQQEINRLEDKNSELQSDYEHLLDKYNIVIDNARNDDKENNKRIDELKEKAFELRTELTSCQNENNTLKNLKDDGKIEGDNNITGNNNENNKSGDNNIYNDGENKGIMGDGNTGNTISNIDQTPKYEKVDILVGNKGAAIPLAPNPDNNNLTMAIETFGLLGKGEDVNPEDIAKKMFVDQVYVLAGTAIEKISEPTNSGVLSMIKVRVLEGANKGKEGWVSASVIGQEERLVAENKK